MNKLLFILGAAALVAAAMMLFHQNTKVGLKGSNKAWKQWKQTYGKSYSQEEESYRFQIFQQNYQQIQSHDASLGYTVGLNKFSDMSSAEFKKTHLGFNGPTVDFNLAENLKADATSIDWRTSGAVSPVKDQGDCGSCWSFSTTGVMESTARVFQKSQVLLSEQMLMDCDSTDDGCDGGLMDNAFKWIIKNGGLTDEASYPYKAVQGKCESKGKPIAMKISKYTDLKGCQGLLDGLQIQPIAIAVFAEPWQTYTGGILAYKDCIGQLDHGVLAVGYTPDYWIVKNSWNADWGENGYIRLQKGTGLSNTCGLCNDPSYPTV